MLFHDLTAVSILAIKIMSFFIKDCGILISLLTNSQPWHLCPSVTSSLIVHALYIHNINYKKLAASILQGCFCKNSLQTVSTSMPA